MRFSRTDFVPLLAIIVGGTIGASFTFRALESRSAAADMPASERRVRPPAETPPAETSTRSTDAIVPGQEVTVDLPDGSSMTGLAVAVLKQDGTTALAIFRGPRRLAEVASGGTFEFGAEPWPVRVQMLGPGEEVRR